MPGPAMIALRESNTCFRCGLVTLSIAHSCHHRIRRAAGGDGWANQVHVCGTGTTGCHGWIHANPVQAQDDGFIVKANTSPPIDPSTVPVRHYMWGPVRLTSDGDYDLAAA